MALIWPQWQRREKKCEVILSKLKEEVLRNPYANPNADVIPYTQMFAAEFRKWNTAREKEIIRTLFLHLYERDVQSLRRDLCKLEPQQVLCKLKASDTAKARFPKRAQLLNGLYGVISLYNGDGEDFSSILEFCGQGIKFGWRKDEIIETLDEIVQIEQTLYDFKEEVCRNPDADFSPYTQELMHRYRIMEAACTERVINTLFLNLYEQDAPSLKRDLLKVQMLGTAKATLSQYTNRTALLQCLYGALFSYIGEDFSDIIAMCDKVKRP